EQALHALARRIGSQAIPVVADIARTEGCRRLAQAAEEHGASVLINNAGINCFGLFEEGTITDTERQFRTNLVSPVMLTKMLLPRLLTLPSAHIINIGSTLGSLGHPGYSVYCASKFGLRGFSEALARELADTPVHVSYLAPRATRTGINSPAADALTEAMGS